MAGIPHGFDDGVDVLLAGIKGPGFRHDPEHRFRAGFPEQHPAVLPEFLRAGFHRSFDGGIIKGLILIIHFNVFQHLGIHLAAGCQGRQRQIGIDHGGHDHDADEVFTSWGRETSRKFDPDTLREALDKLSESNEFGAILRAKGIVQLTDLSWAEFDMVPENVEIREGRPDYTSRLCVIGSELQEQKIEALFGL